MRTQKNEAGSLLPRAFTFNASDRQVRTVVIDGEPFFVAKDVCDILELTNARMAVQSIDEDERRKYCLPRQGETWLVNESGLYHLIFQSRKPEAKAFRRWVTSEVLPAIRRIGRYDKPDSHRQPGRMSRGEGVRADMLDLLWLIGENLERGDQSRIALELGVSRITVNRTLNGYNRSSRVLMALYRTAKANREKQLLYSEPGLMAARLRGVAPDAPSATSGQGTNSSIAGTPGLPEVRIVTNRRGGQYGNQNARKRKEKEV